jgi:hypothetical protein
MTLTLPKILLLLVVAWLAWRFLKRHNIVGGSNGGAQPRATPNQQANRKADGAIEDMVKCPKCGSYVPAKGAHDCAGA